MHKANITVHLGDLILEEQKCTMSLFESVGLNETAID